MGRKSDKSDLLHVHTDLNVFSDHLRTLASTQVHVNVLSTRYCKKQNKNKKRLKWILEIKILEHFYNFLIQLYPHSCWLL